MKVKCDDVVGGLGCSYEATGATPDELKRDLIKHGDHAHGDLLDGLPPDVAAQRKVAMNEHIDELLTHIR